MAITPDVVWVGLKARIEAVDIGTADRVAHVDGFKAVNSVAEMDQLATDRVTAVEMTQGPMLPTDAMSRCRERLLFTITTYYTLESASLERALRDSPKLRDAIRTLSVSVPGVVSGAKVEPAIWDYQRYAGENAVVLVHSALIEYEAVA